MPISISYSVLEKVLSFSKILCENFPGKMSIRSQETLITCRLKTSGEYLTSLKAHRVYHQFKYNFFTPKKFFSSRNWDWFLKLTGNGRSITEKLFSFLCNGYYFWSNFFLEEEIFYWVLCVQRHAHSWQVLIWPLESDEGSVTLFFSLFSCTIQSY